MRKLILKNNNISKIDIFKNILLDFFKKAFGQVFNIKPILKALATTRFKNINKKRLKG